MVVCGGNKSSYKGKETSIYECRTKAEGREFYLRYMCKNTFDLNRFVKKQGVFFGNLGQPDEYVKFNLGKADWKLISYKEANNGNA